MLSKLTDRMRKLETPINRTGLGERSTDVMIQIIIAILLHGSGDCTAAAAYSYRL